MSTAKFAKLGDFKQETERMPTAVSVSVVSSVNRALFTVFLRELLSILHEFGTIFAVLFCQVGPQWMLRLGAVHQGKEILQDYRQKDKNVHYLCTKSHLF